VNKFLSIITLLVASASAVAGGYVTAGDGSIVKTGSDLCLRTGYYTATDAVKVCDAVPVAPPKPVPVTLNSDVLFAFDSATLTVAGKAALDALAPKVAGQGFVEGHTDRIGTVGYNKTLSVARAKAVADYLGTKTKSTFVVSGVGATQPSVKTAQCIGPMSQQLIACLAPDRRVVITIIK
jgi:outer membrane protein OmpA-like peptidoglycan-associated protein